MGPRDVDVAVLEFGQGASSRGLREAAASADAIVLSLPGGGHVAETALEPVTEIAEAKPVVFVSRAGGGVLTAT
jgi:L-asparaginase/Glu-tRNA(Gln) amidotransferase subunit D